MKVTEQEYHFLDRAYAKLKEEMKPETENEALQILDILEEHFKQGEVDNEAILRLYTSGMADSVSATGMAGIFLPDFKTFLSLPDTSERLKCLYDLRKSANTYNYQLATRVKGIGLLSYLDDCAEFFKNGRPILYTNRILVLLFIDLFTTIADDGKLNKVKKKLNVKKEQFEYIQVEIREKVNEYIKLKQIEWENRFVKAAIPWYVE